MCSSDLATEGDVPGRDNATYYGQRASAGLIITEATNVTPMSCALEKAPGIYSDAQVEGWKLVTQEVHARGGPVETYAAVADMLDECGVADVHLADTNAWAGQPDMPKILDVVRPRFRGVLIGNGGITPDAARELVATGALDIVAFGRPFLANPDLPARIRQGGPYNEPRSIGW